MKLVSYKTEASEHLGVFVDGHIYNLNSCDKLIPDNMNAFLRLLKSADITNLKSIGVIFVW
jgi:hypothetical protein